MFKTYKAENMVYDVFCNLTTKNLENTPRKTGAKPHQKGANSIKKAQIRISALWVFSIQQIEHPIVVLLEQELAQALACGSTRA